MKKSDLKFGNVVELRNGDKLIYIQTTENTYGSLRNLIDLKDGISWISTNRYNDDLTLNKNEMVDETDKEFNIVKVYEDYTCQKVLWERKEKPKLTEDEIKILKALKLLGFKYLARDKYENGLYGFIEKPYKYSEEWDCGFNPLYLKQFSDDLFQFIKWEDEEPYSIEELLNGK